MGPLLGVGLCLACGPTPSVPPESGPAHTPPEQPPSPVEPPRPPLDEGGPSKPLPLPGSTDARRPWLRASFYAGVAPGGIAPGDFNEDGAPDLVLSARGRNHQGDYAVRLGEFPVLLNDGAGHLALAALPLRGTSSGRLVAGDLDGDGHLDALVGMRDGVRVLRGRGDGSLRGDSWYGGGGVISSLGLWPLGSGASAFWALGNQDRETYPGGNASFKLMRPTGPATWMSSSLSLTDYNDERLAAVVADFNEDGLPDAAMNFAHSRLWDGHILLGTAWGEVASGVSLPTPTAFFLRVSAADFNRDGHVDLLGLSAASLEVFLGDGHGGFVREAQVPLALATEEAVVLDYDGDGQQDVVALHGAASEVSLFRGQGTGALVPHGRLAVGRSPSAAAVADLDRDGAPELLIAEADANAVSVYAIPPTPEPGPFAPLTCPLRLEPDAPAVEVTAEPLARLDVGPAPTASRSLGDVQAVGDFDGDGRTDLALVRAEGVRLVLHREEGLLTRDVPDTAGAWAIAAGDLDGDGRAELAVTVFDPELKTSLLWNDAEGVFRWRSDLGECHAPLVADFNGDGRLDLAVTPVGCVGGVLRLTGVEARAFRVDLVDNHNVKGDGWCAGASRTIAGDYDGNGTLDLVHTTLGINLNPTAKDGTSLPGHGFELDFPFGEQAWSVDADGDGRLDVVARRGATKAEALFFRGDGHGSLEAPFTFALPPVGRLLSWADLDGDGRAELVGESPDARGLWVAPGSGGGRWGEPRHYALGGEVEWARGVDLLGDARPELVVLMRSGELRVYPTP